MSLLLFTVEGTPCVLSPYFFGDRHFCTNAQLHSTDYIQSSRTVFFGKTPYFNSNRIQRLALHRAFNHYTEIIYACNHCRLQFT